MGLADLRREYTQGGLSEADLAADPFAQFERWFNDAQNAGVHEPNAMALGTVDSDGQPAVRIVLLKGFGPDGFRFFTNYESRKGRELAENPRVSLCFLWHELERQVRIEGRAERLSDADNDAYFKSRPRGSQWGAWTSNQSSVVPDRRALEARLAEIEASYPEEVPRPPFWGGFRIVPSRVEFWQGRPSRLHDRLTYGSQGDGWTVERLAP